jgi:HPt (histidine-containing phosphotransfer) domain-containing protein
MQLGCEGDDELLREVIVTFIDDSRQRIAGLHEALRSEESTALRRQAHSLKGSANQIGAKPMAALCKQLEQRDGEQPHDRLLAMLEQLDAVFQATTQVMLAHVNTPL